MLGRTRINSKKINFPHNENQVDRVKGVDLYRACWPTLYNEKKYNNNFSLTYLKIRKQVRC